MSWLCSSHLWNPFLFITFKKFCIPYKFRILSYCILSYCNLGIILPTTVERDVKLCDTLFLWIAEKHWSYNLASHRCSKEREVMFSEQWRYQASSNMRKKNKTTRQLYLWQILISEFILLIKKEWGKAKMDLIKPSNWLHWNVNTNKKTT